MNVSYSFILVVLLLGISAFSCGKPPVQNILPTDITCDDGTRYLMNCESSEWAYEGNITEAHGGFTATKWIQIKADAKNETEAIRQVSDELKSYAAQWKRLCQSYNSCAMSKAEYVKQSQLIGNRLDGVDEAYNIMHATDASPEEKRAALAATYTKVVPKNEQISLELTFSVLNEKSEPVPQGYRFLSGERLAFQIETSKDAYVYIFQKNASGEIGVLFPDQRISLVNPLPAEHTTRIPSGEVFFKLDNKDIGMETVYIVASLRQITTMEQASQIIAKGEKPTQHVEQLTALAAQNENTTCSRGLELDSPQQNDCARSRGIVLDSNDETQASLTATSEAADDTIIQLFTFEHAKPQDK